MELPSIKLNIFKKLEYFLVLKELNRQFDNQLSILKLQKYDTNSRVFKNAAYPIWEIEKKVLFWTYAYHKFINHELQSAHFKDMLISEEESKHVGGQRNIFGNLKQHGFAKLSEDGLGCIITKDGLAFGELLWYLYNPKKCDIKEDVRPDVYWDIYKTNYLLSRKSLGWVILQFQLLSMYLITVYVVALFTLEILTRLDLVNNLQKIFKSMPALSLDIFWIMIVSTPFIVFVTSFLGDFIYKWLVVNNKYRYIERLK